MARVTYRANLSAKMFPFLSRDKGRSIIVPQSDQNYAKYVTVEASVERDVGIPQLYYCHNVLPIDSGIASVGFTPLVNPVAGERFVDCWSARAENVDYKLAVTATGNFYTVTGASQDWTLLDTISAAAATRCYVVIVQGVTYLQISGADCYRFGKTASPKTAPTATVGASGVLLGDYYYKVTYVTAAGETDTGPFSEVVS